MSTPCEETRRRLEARLQELVYECRAHGFTPRLEVESLKPLAMGRYHIKAQVDPGPFYYRGK